MGFWIVQVILLGSCQSHALKDPGIKSHFWPLDNMAFLLLLSEQKQNIRVPRNNCIANWQGWSGSFSTSLSPDFQRLASKWKRKETLPLTCQPLKVCGQCVKLTANIFLEAEGTCCLVPVYGLPTLLVHKIVQWLYTVWCWLRAFFQLGSATATGATIGQFWDKPASSLSPVQVLTCVAISEFMVITLWRHLSAKLIFSWCCATS